MDILEELPMEQWPHLQEKLKSLWPINSPGYYALHVNAKYPAVRDAFKFKVYCPHGNMDNGFVALTEKDQQDVIIFSITEDTSKLEEALLKTKLIDWSKDVLFAMVPSTILQTLERVKAVMQFDKYQAWPALMYYLNRTAKLSMELRLPPGTYMSAVKPEDIPRVSETWAYTSSYAHHYFMTLATIGLSYGLYSSDTEELLAWLFINEYNNLTHLYCEEKHRRRGYGEYIMYCAVNDLLKDGHDVYAYIAEGNDKSLNIFNKSGFKFVDDAAFVVTSKYFNKC